MKFTTLSLIASVFISAVFATHTEEGANQVAHVGADAAKDVYASVAKRHNHFSRRKITNLLAKQKKVCDHHNHKTYKTSDDHKKHLKAKTRTQTRPKRVQHVAPARPQRVQSSNCAGVSHGCINREEHDEPELEYNNDFAEDEFAELDGDDDFYECDECDACDSDDDDDDERHMSSSDWEDETT